MSYNAPMNTDTRNMRLGAPGCDDSKRSPDEVRIIKEMTKEEVELFLSSNNIDTAAARELRSEQPWVAWAVLERGPLRACTNPSGALVARIRDAKRGLLGNNSRYGGVPQQPANMDPSKMSELDLFLHENRIDQAGMASLRSEPLEVQRAVMAKGPLINTNNPSASLMARIRMVKMDRDQGTGMFSQQTAPASFGGPGAGPMPMLPPPGPPPGAGGMHAAGGPGRGPSAAPIDNSSLNLSEEAMKAIQKLGAVKQANEDAHEPRWKEARMESKENGVQRPGDTSGSAITNSQDQNLQLEALKAIEQLNAQ